MSNFTRQAIRNSLIRLLNERPVSRITVRDIAEDCGINRNTFYYHYADLPSLLEEIITTEADRIISSYTEFSSIEECFDVVIGFASENKKAVLNIHNSSDRDLYERYLWRICEHAVSTFIHATVSPDVLSAEEFEIVTGHYKCLCFGLVTDWLSSGMKNDVRADFHRFCELKRRLGDPVLSKVKTQ